MEFFDNIMIEKNLDDRISSIIKNIDRDIFYYRFFAEKGHFVYNYLNLMKENKFKINKEIIEIATMNVSAYFIPELMHSNLFEYSSQYKYIYNTYKNIIFNCKFDRVNIIEIGAGLIDLALYLCDFITNINSYEIYEIDKNIIYINKYFSTDNNIIKYFNINFADIDFSKKTNVTHIIINNVLKLYSDDIVINIIKNILFKIPNITILLQDCKTIIDKIINFLEKNNIDYSKYDYNIIAIGNKN